MQQVGTAGKGLFPSFNTIEANLIDTVGVYGKQTSAYFKAKSRENTVRNNIMMNGNPTRLNPIQPSTIVDCCIWSAPSEDCNNSCVQDLGPASTVRSPQRLCPLMDLAQWFCACGSQRRERGRRDP